MRCRREFYEKHPEAKTEESSPEVFGEPAESYIYSPDESLSLSLEYFNPSLQDTDDVNNIMDSPQKTLPKRYLRCPAAVTVFHLQKLIRAKYGLSEVHRIDIIYQDEPLCGNYTLMDIMYIYHWKTKVPLHLSYRIFESSPKRIKLSEDNINYTKSLKNVGINDDREDDQLVKREWKEVQLKISETGVMSVMDISSPDSKKNTKIEEIGEFRKELSKHAGTDGLNKSELSKQAMQNIIENKTDSDGEKDSADINDIKVKCNRECSEVSKGASQNIQSQVQAAGGIDKSDKAQKSAGQKAENKINQSSVEKKSSNNNNNISVEKTDPKSSQKAGNDSKTNAGSKIDALSAKLQFQPKIGQVNNTYSKKSLKEKKTGMQGVKKSGSSEEAKNDAKNSESGSLKRTNNATTTKVSVSQSSPSVQTTSSFSVSSSTIGQFTVSTNSSRNSDKKQDTNTQSSTVEKKRSSAEDQDEAAKSYEEQKTLNRNNNSSCNDNSSSTNANASTATNQGTSTFPYTVQDIVNNVTLKSSGKTSNTGQKSTVAGAPVNTASYSLSDIQTSSISQFIHSPSMSIYSVSTSPKSSYATASNTANTTSVTSKQSKPNFEITNYSVPPCPDAIPISLMKPTTRKHGMISKSSNLNEICAKIGTSGSKINDICAKIGENSKEKRKAQSSEIPDLLKINKKQEIVKHIPNIPNVPIYTPSSVAGTDSKGVYKEAKGLPGNQQTTTSSHTTQKVTLKKQGQPVGYKTLRDPPKTWNPTLSKNNYVAVKNQKEIQNQTQSGVAEGNAKMIASKPAKIFKMRNTPRFLGNPASGVKPMYGVTESKDKEQAASKGASLNMMKIDPKTLSPISSTVNMMKIDPKTLSPIGSTVNMMKIDPKTFSPIGSTANMMKIDPKTFSPIGSTANMMKIDPKTFSPIVSTVNSPIVSPPPYSPNARSYQNTPFPRDICRNTGSPISPRNSPVNMLSTNPFIPSPTPNTNPRLIYSHFPPPYSDASRFPNPLIRSPIGIPPPSAFHSSLPPSINKIYQRSTYLPQTTVYSPVSQPPTVQRIPPSTHSSTLKSPKNSSSSSAPTFNLVKAETQTSVSSSMTLKEANAFNLSKSSAESASDFLKSTVDNEETSKTSPGSSPSKSKMSSSGKTNSPEKGNLLSKSDKKEVVGDGRKNSKVEGHKDIEGGNERTEKTEAQSKAVQESSARVNGDIGEDVGKSKEDKNKDEQIKDLESGKEKTSEQGDILENESKKEDLGKTEQIQCKKPETQRSKAES
ncbi:serine-rich adhesin for platelets-like isoform X2 [Prorops nasuta]